MKYIFWDFNGTILNDVDLCLDILNSMLLEEGCKKVTKKKYLEMFTFPVVKYYIKAGLDFNKTPFDVLAHRFMKKYQKASLSENLYPNVVDTVNRFKAKGYKNIVLSASKYDNLVEQLKHFNIFDLFDDVLGTKDIYAKTKIDIALKYVKDNNINSKDIIMIGDTLHDAHIAKKLGAEIFINGNGHQSRKRLKNYKIVDNYNNIDI